MKYHSFIVGMLVSVLTGTCARGAEIQPGDYVFPTQFSATLKTDEWVTGQVEATDALLVLEVRDDWLWVQLIKFADYITTPEALDTTEGWISRSEVRGLNEHMQVVERLAQEKHAAHLWLFAGMSHMLESDDKQQLVKAVECVARAQELDPDNSWANYEELRKYAESKLEALDKPIFSRIADNFVDAATSDPKYLQWIASNSTTSEDPSVDSGTSSLSRIADNFVDEVRRDPNYLRTKSVLGTWHDQWGFKYTFKSDGSFSYGSFGQGGTWTKTETGISFRFSHDTGPRPAEFEWVGDELVGEVIVTKLRRSVATE